MKVLRWAGRTLAILSGLLALILFSAGSWMSGLEALILAGVVWFWSDLLASRRGASGRAKTADPAQEPPENA